MVVLEQTRFRRSGTRAVWSLPMCPRRVWFRRPFYGRMCRRLSLSLSECRRCPFPRPPPGHRSERLIHQGKHSGQGCREDRHLTGTGRSCGHYQRKPSPVETRSAKEPIAIGECLLLFSSSTFQTDSRTGLKLLPKSGILVGLRMSKGDLGLSLMRTVHFTSRRLSRDPPSYSGSSKKLTASTTTCEGSDYWT